jgi:predicted RNA-binding protein
MLSKEKDSKIPSIEPKKNDYIELNGVGKKQLIHPYFEKWFNYISNEYKIPKACEIIAFIPCAAIKPYKNSPIHKEFNRIFKNYPIIKKVVISNAGIIPYEFSTEFPFDSYDWNPLNENDEIQALYRKITQKRLITFLKYIFKQKEIKLLSYLRCNSDSFWALKNACDSLGIELNVVKIEGNLEKNKDEDLILIFDNNLEKLKKMINKIVEENNIGVLRKREEDYL